MFSVHNLKYTIRSSVVLYKTFKIVDCVAPVSYTHLDVYKRQVCVCVCVCVCVQQYSVESGLKVGPINSYLL